VNPGLCKTELSRESKSWTFSLMIALLARTAEQGSRTLTHAAIGTDGENFKGEYLSNCKVDEYSPFVQSPEGQATGKKLWNELIEILVKVAPEVANLF
jgi:retinol dehydrogenase 12